MLKALELVGFKSFADKTRFEFPAGITVIVGPNGSGKSNVVDAIKWVLGEQSAKSLRGQDMADVIFKGAGAGRKPMNAAEATLIFDNTDRRLPVDAPEVQVTRRVYRSGESEYLVNRQPCRLRDLRDIVRGTGVGADAYSLIEQGKVDRLLSASARDRRAIFEEAAGISRFKAKRIECQRRLARVEQNLLRLSDIVDEVTDRLKSVRAQASKARRYRECAERLQQLRTHVGRVDWRQLSEQLAAEQEAIGHLRIEVDEATEHVAALEGTARRIDDALASAAEAEQQSAARLSQIRERIAALETASEHERARRLEIAEQVATLARQAAALRVRLAEIERKSRAAAQAADEAERERERIAAAARERDSELQAIAAVCQRRRDEVAALRHKHMEAMRSAAAISSQVSAGRSRRSAFTQAAEEAERHRQSLQAQLQTQAAEVSLLQSREQVLADEARQHAGELEQAQHDLATARRVLARRQDEFSQLRLRRSAASERATILEELERRLEGLGAGVKEVLARSRQEPRTAFGDVRGLVADLFQVTVELAPLVDAALGETAQHVVLSSDRLLSDLASGAWRPPGRVGFLIASAEDHAEQAASHRVDLGGEPGVIARADRAVQCDDEFQGLAERLLARVWLVETLADALRLARRHADLKFVTGGGEVVEPGGLVLVGSRQAAAGLISRRSELRSLTREIAEIDQQLSGAQREIGSFQEQIKQQESRVESLTRAGHAASENLAVHRLLLQTALAAHEQLGERGADAEAAAAEAVAACEAVQAELDALCGAQEATEGAIQEHEEKIAAVEQLLQSDEARRDELARQATAIKVDLAKSEERTRALGAQARQLAAEGDEKRRSWKEASSQIAQQQTRGEQAELAVLFAASACAELHLAKEEQQARAEGEKRLRAEHQAQRGEIAGQAEQTRRRLHEASEQLHRRELAAGDLSHQRASLADRLREDYGIEPADLAREVEGEEEGDSAERRAEIDAEILELRRKINHIGAVNLDALAELDDLELRAGALTKQFQDLTQARQSLERIIDRINADSRRLFVETLDAIRVNFQALYRKAFGGGNADLVLENSEDVLECGVDIVATPPGKPSFNNSLLSGGEKALTAVALLLAIFQFRPSPFCVLDEVDAPFDEANIGRFVDVLGEFLSWTRFVIVTHSKKTMTAAHTLYGVTMEESGVSKRVSVRFEDVSEDGEISPRAAGRDGPDAAVDERGAA
jgi:chromosome segregation protein